MEELHSRGESLAESFFAKRDKELIENLRKELSSEEDRTSLKAASGIEDEAVLQGLVDARHHARITYGRLANPVGDGRLGGSRDGRI